MKGISDMKLIQKRKSYQQGSLTSEKRVTGPDVWIYRWREAGPNGRRVKRKVVVGSTDVLKTKAAAQKAVDGLRLEVNAEAPIVRSRSLTVGELIAHYEQAELDNGSRKSPATKTVYKQFLSSYILPEWGTKTLTALRPIAVERWLESLSYAPATKSKIRNLLSALFQHAIRMEWAETNPIRAVRASAKRLREPDILTPEETNALIAELPEPCRTMALLAALTGLRISEVLGLQWQDVDLEGAVIRLRRGIVNQQVSDLKTAGSKRPLPIPSALVEALSEWKKQTSFSQTEDWVFASPQANGDQPYWPGTLLQRHLKPAALRVGIAKQIGWHSFRRSFATLLYANEQDVKTAQELMRHATPNVTMGIYAQAVTEAKRQAQERLANMILNAEQEAISA
jgi:integrase